QGPAHGRAAGVQPPAGRAAGVGGAVDRAPAQRVGAAPLARAAVPRPGRLPGRWRARLPRPVAPSHPHMRTITDTLTELPCSPQRGRRGDATATRKVPAAVGTAQRVPDVVRLDAVMTGAWSGRWMTGGSQASSVRSTRGWSGSCGC